MSPSETSPTPSADNARIADMSEGGRSGTGGPQAMQVVAAQEKKSWMYKWADTGSKLFQIAALTVAGAWAWFGFKQSVAPGLETKVGVSSELHWVAVPGTKRGTKICEASLQVKVNNPGKSPFDVAKATVTGWLVPLKENGLFPTDASDPKAVSPGKVSLLKYFYTGNGGSVSHDVADHYTEGVENTASFDLFFKYKPLTLVAFYVQIEGKRPSSYRPFLAAQVPLKDSYTYQVGSTLRRELGQSYTGAQAGFTGEGSRTTLRDSFERNASASEDAAFYPPLDLQNSFPRQVPGGFRGETMPAISMHHNGVYWCHACKQTRPPQRKPSRSSRQAG